LSTKDFVKKTGRDKYWELLEEEMKLLQGDDGLLKPEYSRPVRCAVCTADNYSRLFVKEGFTFVKCNECGLIYVNPQCDEKKLMSDYEKAGSNDYWVDVLLSSTEQEFNINKFTDFCQRLEGMVEGRKVLDVGCSVGTFLDIARNRGWETTGIELGKKAHRYATEELGLEVIRKPIQDSGLSPESFDAVTLWEVLEHVPDPLDILKQCWKVLKPGGALAALVPNRDALSARIMRQCCSCFGGRNHLWYFSPDNLKAVMGKAGFRVTGQDTILHQVEEILTYLNFKDPYRDSLSDNDFDLPQDTKAGLEKFIFDNHLGYKLLMFASKD